MPKFITLQFIFILLFGSNTYSQNCMFQVDPQLTEVCVGDTVCITASGNISGAIIDQFDFNTSTLPSGWTVTGGASFGQPCGTSLTGTDYYWSSTSGTMMPTVTTSPMDVSLGAIFQFDLVYALQGGASPCEGPDAWDEGVSFQYSLDGGSTWVQIAYFNPDGTMQAVPNGGTTGPTAFTSWGTYCFPVPPAAQTVATMFRWIQTTPSSANFDNWGLDEIVISNSQVGTTVSWSNGTVNSPSICVPIVSDTTFIAYLLSSIGDTLYQDQVVVNVLSGFQTNDSVTICPNTDYIFADGTLIPNITSPTTHTSTFQDANGCDSTITTTVVPVTNLFQANDSLSICPNTDYIFADGTLIPNITSPVTHASIFQDINGCDSTIITTVVPTAIFATVSQADSTLTALNSGVGVTYSWVDCANNFAPLVGDTNQTFTPTQSGTYALVVTQNGCSDTSSCYTINFSGLNEISWSKVLIYPNPTAKNFTIDLGKLYKDVSIRVVDGLGRIIYGESFETAEKIEAKLNGNSGFYFVEVLIAGQRFMATLSKE